MQAPVWRTFTLASTVTVTVWTAELETKTTTLCKIILSFAGLNFTAEFSIGSKNPF